ncbi:MAG: hydroxymethylbilane synthase [Solirubrobacterales bacterium]|nr:hydroxymethylbilane synthase [Solirubrobacterales bacterium]
MGTRGSALALAQAQHVLDALAVPAELVPIRTSGDERGGVPVAAAGDDKSRFVREIESALLDGRIDLAVHSAKDVPGELPEGLAILGVPARLDPADAWIGPGGSLAEIPEGARVGTASLRRRSQLLALRPDLDVVELRGNVDTRLRKLADGEVDGIVLAAAGLERLGRAGEIAFRFGAEELTPAPGQGALALEGRIEGVEHIAPALTLTDGPSLIELTAERAAVRGLDASCHTPVGICARFAEGGGLRITGFAGLPDGASHVLDSVLGDPEQPVALAEALVESMTDAGALDLLARAEEWSA